MPQVKRFSRLPEHVQNEVETHLVANGFTGYSELARALQARGYRISRSALHRAGKALKGEYQALQALDAQIEEAVAQQLSANRRGRTR